MRSQLAQLALALAIILAAPLFIAHYIEPQPALRLELVEQVIGHKFSCVKYKVGTQLVDFCAPSDIVDPAPITDACADALAGERARVVCPEVAKRLRELEGGR